jgi:TolB protein
MGRRRSLVVTCLVLLAVLVAAGTGSAVPAATRQIVRGNGSIALAGGPSLLSVNPSRPGAVRTIAACPAASTAPRREPPPPIVGACGFFEPAWSPGGGRLAFVRGRFGDPREPNEMSLYVSSANGTHAKRLASCGSCGWYWGSRLAWSPDGRWIAFDRGNTTDGSESLWIVAASGGRPHRVVSLVNCSEWCVAVDPAWSPNGRRLLYEHPKSTLPGIFTIRRDGSDRQKIAVGTDPQWSPDGRRVSFEDYTGLKVVHADGSHPHLIFAQTDEDDLGGAAWSPDGKQLVLVNLPGGQQGPAPIEIRTVNADGSGEQRLYFADCCVLKRADPIWSPDGKKIAFAVSTDKDAGGTFVIGADGDGLTQLGPNIPGYGGDLSWQRRPRR